MLSFDEKAALLWAELMAEGEAKGRPRDPMDTIIASVAQAHGCVIVTNNLRDFRDLGAIDPTTMQ